MHINLLTKQEVAERLSVPEASLDFWRSQGKSPPFVKIGRSVMYPEHLLEEFIRENIKTSTRVGGQK